MKEGSEWGGEETRLTSGKWLGLHGHSVFQKCTGCRWQGVTRFFWIGFVIIEPAPGQHMIGIGTELSLIRYGN